MAVRAERRRDRDVLRGGLQAWVADRWTGVPASRVTAMTSFSGGGLSNETIGVDVEWNDGQQAGQARLVVRFPPKGPGVFKDYDLAREQRIQAALSAVGFPVPHPVVYENDPGWVGEPFVAMPRVEGRVPESQPRPYTQGGWLHDLPPQSRRVVLDRFTDLLADLHRIDWRQAGLDVPHHSSGPGLAAELTWWRDYFDWAAVDNPSEDSAGVRTLYDWCADHRPAEEPPPSFLWGDARLGNVVFGLDLAVVAALDWEGATVGPAELDLGWHLAHRRNMLERLGREALPELAGFADRRTQMQRYEQRLGRTLADLDWYELFGAAALATCRLAIQRASIRAGASRLGGSPVRHWAVELMRRAA